MSPSTGSVPRRKTRARRAGSPGPDPFPRWIRPQLTELVATPPEGPAWAHEIKLDGYRMHARLEHGRIQLLTRTGLDWTDKYKLVAEALSALRAESAYLDGELCAFRADGRTSFSDLQAATDSRRSAGLVFVAFDLLYHDGRDLRALPLRDRKARLEQLLGGGGPMLKYSDHYIGEGGRFFEAARQLGVEGIVSKRLDAPYVSDDRGLWRKIKCYHREEFIIVGFTNPEGGRPYLSSLLLAYYGPTGRLTYAGRGAGSIPERELRRLYERLKPLETEASPLDTPPPTTSRFGAPLKLSEVRWVRPELVCESRFLAWTAEGMLRQAIYQGLRDTLASEVRHDPSGVALEGRAEPSAAG